MELFTLPKKAKGKGNGTFDRKLKATSTDGSSTKFYLEYEARAAAVFQAAPGRWFALYLTLHYKPRKQLPTEHVQSPHYKPRKQLVTEHVQAQAQAPPDFPREVLEMIIAVQSKATLTEFLESKQRFMKLINIRDLGLHHNGQVPDHTTKVRMGFPCVSEDVSGYRHNMSPALNQFQDGKVSFTVVQGVQPASVHDVTWTVTVDANQVIINEESRLAVEQLKIPDTAVTVETNVRMHMEKLKLAPARVVELENYKLKARFEWGGSEIKFLPVDPEKVGHNGAVGFKVRFAFPWIDGKTLHTHSSITIGDRVRLTDAFAMYKPWAVGHEVVVREIRMFKYAVYYVEFQDAALTAEVQRVHKNGTGLQLGQLETQLACRRFQMDLITGTQKI